MGGTCSGIGVIVMTTSSSPKLTRNGSSGECVHEMALNSQPVDDIYLAQLARSAHLLSRYDHHLHYHSSPDLEDFIRRFLGERALDLGCGDGRGSRWLRSMGLRAVGLDTAATEGVQLIGDGHMLPFRDRSFSVVLRLKVLEHVWEPTRFLEEVHRVLKPGSLFLGSVAFLEPYHGRSYFHFSALALANLLSRTGFRVVELSPGYSMLSAFLEMSFPFPRLGSPFPMVEPFGRLLQGLLLSARRVVGFAYARLTGQMKEYRRMLLVDELRFSGEFSFVSERV